MTDKTYNGWTNYETWRVMLEMFDGIDLRDYEWHKFDDYDLSLECKNYAVEILDQAPDGLTKDYAMAFIDAVNWREIAEHLIEDYAEV